MAEEEDCLRKRRKGRGTLPGSTMHPSSVDLSEQGDKSILVRVSFFIIAYTL